MHIYTFVRAVARFIDRSLDTSAASDLIERQHALLNRNGRFLEVRCAFAAALVANEASDELYESFNAEACTPSVRRLADLFLAFPLKDVRKIWPVPWRLEEHPREGNRVLHLFGEFIAALALGSPSRHFTELTVERMLADVAARSCDAWRMILDPAHPAVLTRVIEDLTDQEVHRLIRVLTRTSLVRNPNYGVYLADLFPEIQRGPKRPLN